ncbi:hypothetical protein PJ267_16200 [Arthrobacter sp. OVS8]|nr:hypothetical protein PJ267_16200 [Arthrobacter sp. OVS8]
MRQTNRALNRSLLALLGLVLLAAGVLTAAAGLVPEVAAAWTATAAAGLDRSGELLSTAPLPGAARSWWAVAAVTGLLLASGLSVAWLASQGGGRTPRAATDLDGDRGSTVVDIEFVAACVSATLAGNLQVLGTSVSAWRVHGTTGLRLRLEARKGASPREIADTAEELVLGLDRLLGHPVPVLVRITSGTRSRLAGVNRVH